VLVPARNEADVIRTSVGSLLAQDYPGKLMVIVTDDASTDGTGGQLEVLLAGGQGDRLRVVHGTGPAQGWSGKLYALEQARQRAEADGDAPVYWWLSDADIYHDPAALTRLVTHAEGGDYALVSTMVRLNDRGFWPGLLIPAFVFFFQMLYPFRLINRPWHRIAGAAGGCVLLRREALRGIGGFASLHDALIDDCTLGQRVKAAYGRIWLGLSNSQNSIRPYQGLGEIWRMVARTAFTQLRFSPWLLAGTLVGMALVFLAAPIALFFALVLQAPWLGLMAMLVWGLMAFAYWPMLRWYGRSWEEGFLLPFAATLYNAMTFDSALQHWRGKGGNWKGRHQASASSAGERKQHG